MEQLTEIVLKGTERIEELPEEWREKYGPDNGKRCYKSVMLFPNPLNSADPVIHEILPLFDPALQPGETRDVTDTFFIFKRGIYALVRGEDPVKREYVRYLKGCTRNSRLIIHDGDEVKIPEKI